MFSTSLRIWWTDAQSVTQLHFKEMVHCWWTRDAYTVETSNTNTKHCLLLIIVTIYINIVEMLGLSSLPRPWGLHGRPSLRSLPRRSRSSCPEPALPSASHCPACRSRTLEESTETQRRRDDTGESCEVNLPWSQTTDSRFDIFRACGLKT